MGNGEDGFPADLTPESPGVGRVEQSETRQRLPPTHREIVIVFQQLPKTMPGCVGFRDNALPDLRTCSVYPCKCGASYQNGILCSPAITSHLNPTPKGLVIKWRNCEIWPNGISSWFSRKLKTNSDA